MLATLKTELQLHCNVDRVPPVILLREVQPSARYVLQDIILLLLAAVLVLFVRQDPYLQ